MSPAQPHFSAPGIEDCFRNDNSCWSLEFNGDILKSFVSAMSLASLLLGALVFVLAICPAKAIVITVPDDYSTIQQAIDNANGGDTIYVKAGTYFENIIVHKTVSLIGEDQTTTIIDGNGTGNVVRILRDYVNFSQFTVQNSGHEHQTDIECGILLRTPSNCIIADCIVSDNYCGIRLFMGSTNIVLTGNVVKNNYEGILHRSRNSRLRDNSLLNNTNYNFYLDGYTLEEFVNDVDTSNTVNGKPIYYWVDQHNKTVPQGATTVILVNSSGIAIENQLLEGNGAAVLLAYSQHVHVRNITASGNWDGIRTYRSQNITISDNNVTASYYDGVQVFQSQGVVGRGNYIAHNGDAGITVGFDVAGNLFDSNYIACNLMGVELYRGSSDNRLSNNFLSENYYGISLSTNTTDNEIFGNTIMDNEGSGLYVREASDNLIYHNNFVNNTGQVYDLSWSDPEIQASVNLWDAGYPYGGVYWSDHSGADLLSGFHQNEPGSDGIVDEPYIVDAHNMDSYPLRGFFGSFTMKGDNATVFPSDEVGLIFQRVSAEGFTEITEAVAGPPPPPGFEILGNYYEIQTTVVHSGKITARIIYNDSHMTRLEEEDLQLMRWNEVKQLWENITARIDTESNVIYGETGHLSIFGVTRRAMPKATAHVEFNSEALNLRSESDWIHAHIELPRDHNVDAISLSTIMLNDTIPIELAGPIRVEDQDNDCVPDLMVSFNRTEVLEFLHSGNITYGEVALTLGGKLPGIAYFEGTRILMVSSLPGDVDGDGTVTLYDVIAASQAYRSNPDDPRWNPNANFAPSWCTVDIYDIVTILCHYGESSCT